MANLHELASSEKREREKSKKIDQTIEHFYYY